MKTVMLKLKHEFLKVLPPTVFFFVILHIVALIRALMIKGSGVELPVSASVLIAALILGKSVLVADMLPFINRFPDKPLIWNVAWKTCMYALVALIVHYLERLYEYWKEAAGVMDANALLWSSINWPRFWAVQILLITLIFMYCVIAELARVIGRERLKRMFIGPLPPKQPDMPKHSG
ncbi:hypothetical protein OSW16_16190 [Pseudomonas putida]|uniref:hypothetical protein n=1 Tax=Pseudomonas TaxID=286 RepID=UPI001F51CE78|nr:hypothetical protein [Pseudomonas putida]MCI0913304.1 hypothetical protein [Pseudomonas putida]WAB96104.1 hypothetical protein OSW16_16190 [Pseudomonas putida]